MWVCTPALSIEQMLAANPGKTPISLLQEYGTRIGKTPVYDLLKAEGQAHQPNFTFRVTVGDTSCTGEEGWGTAGAGTVSPTSPWGEQESGWLGCQVGHGGSGRAGRTESQLLTRLWKGLDPWVHRHGLTPGTVVG